MRAGSPGRAGAGLRRVGKASAVLVLMVGTIAGIAVLLWPADDPAADVDDLAVEARPAAAATQFVLPASAPLEQAPAGDHGAGCSEADLAWLRTVGHERAAAFRVAVTNRGVRADGELDLVELKVEGTRSLVEEPVLVVDCPAPAALPGADGEPVRVEVDTDGSAPVTQRRADGTAAPFGLGLVAGESRELKVVLAGRQGFRGTVSVRVSDGDRNALVGLPVAGGELDRPGVGPAGPLVVALTGGGAGDQRFRCAEGEIAQPCSALGAKARAARLWERPVLAGTALQAALAQGGCGDPARTAGVLDEAWQGFFRADPAREAPGYDEVVMRPMRSVASACGRDAALAALDATAMARAGHAGDLRAALDVDPAAAPAEPAAAGPASCDEASLRQAADDSGGQPLMEKGDDGGFVYDEFRAHACAAPYALFEASRSGTGYRLFWLLEVRDGRWVARGTSAVAPDSPAGKPLFDCRALADDGLDTSAMWAALAYGEPTAGRAICAGDRPVPAPPAAPAPSPSATG